MEIYSLNPPTRSIRPRVFLKRLLLFSALVWGVIGLSVLACVAGPDQYVFHDGNWDDMHYLPYHNESDGTVLLDGHSHTIHSDGCLTPEQTIQWHIANGFNAAIITDHNTLEGALKTREIARSRYNESFKVLVGMEWTTRRIHMNLVGISDDFIDHFSPHNFKDVPRHPSDRDIQGIITETHRYGGIVIVNHYPRSERSFGSGLPTRDQLFAWGVDYFEVVNDDNYGRSEYDELSYGFSREHSLGTITGTDMHDPTEMRVHGWTILDPSAFTEEAIFSELKGRNTKIIYDYNGAPYTASHEKNPWYVVLKPEMMLGNVFINYVNWPAVDWMSLLIFSAHVYVPFMLFGVFSKQSGETGDDVAAGATSRRKQNLGSTTFINTAHRQAVYGQPFLSSKFVETKTPEGNI